MSPGDYLYPVFRFRGDYYRQCPAVLFQGDCRHPGRDGFHHRYPVDWFRVDWFRADWFRADLFQGD